ncbi:MAG: glutamate racemase [Spirochaetales bacterium]|nr:glutamate racemase [Spirochaetales bacterium]
MSDNPIVFIDSGVGGLPYLKMAKQSLPEKNFVYVADNKNFPYGEKHSLELKKIIIKLIQNIVEKIDPGLIVIACNTASVVALSTLRDKFGIPFVGVVPAIKPAGEYSGNGNIGLLATRKTVEDPYTDKLIKNFASGCNVKKYAGIDLVEFVEKKYLTSSEEEILKVVSDASGFFLDNRIDSLVLGCTHFVYLVDYFKQTLGSSVDIIDSREGVVNQIIRLIKNDKLLSATKNKDVFYMTGSQAEKSNYIKFAEEFNLLWGGNL